MTEISLSQGNTAYQEDISTLAAGTVLVAKPCVVWKIIVSLEASSVAVVNFANDDTSYSNANRVMKVVINGPTTIPLTFPKGLYLSDGLAATSNLASVDIMVVYD